MLNNNAAFNYSKSDGLNYYEKLFNNEKPIDIADQIVFDHYRKLLLSDYLRKTDMMSMLNSVEFRVPFLYEKLIKHAFSIPFRQKIKNGRTKYILRDIHKTIYRGIGYDSRKKGFSIPLDDYLSDSEKKEMIYLINKSDSIISDFVSKPYLQFLSDQFISHTRPDEISRASIYQRVLLLYSIDRWYRVTV